MKADEFVTVSTSLHRKTFNCLQWLMNVPLKGWKVHSKVLDMFWIQMALPIYGWSTSCWKSTTYWPHWVYLVRLMRKWKTVYIAHVQETWNHFLQSQKSCWVKSMIRRLQQLHLIRLFFKLRLLERRILIGPRNWFSTTHNSHLQEILLTFLSISSAYAKCSWNFTEFWLDSLLGFSVAQFPWCLNLLQGCENYRFRDKNPSKLYLESSIIPKETRGEKCIKD